MFLLQNVLIFLCFLNFYIFVIEITDNQAVMNTVMSVKFVFKLIILLPNQGNHKNS
jgi:hypothetical protein